MLINWSDGADLDLSLHAASFIFLYSSPFVLAFACKRPWFKSQLSFPIKMFTRCSGSTHSPRHSPLCICLAPSFPPPSIWLVCFHCHQGNSNLEGISLLIMRSLLLSHSSRHQCYNIKIVPCISYNIFNHVWLVIEHLLDCEQSVFSSKFRGEERKTSNRACVTVTWDLRAVMSPPALATGGSRLVRHAHSHARTATCFTFLPTEFPGKERLLAV